MTLLSGFKPKDEAIGESAVDLLSLEELNTELGDLLDEADRLKGGE